MQFFFCIETTKAYPADVKLKFPFACETDLAVEFLQYDLATIRAATNDFSYDHKLGEGGFGSVYKVIQRVISMSKKYTILIS